MGLVGALIAIPRPPPCGSSCTRWPSGGWTAAERGPRAPLAPGYQVGVMPPSMVISAPVMLAARSLARNST